MPQSTSRLVVILLVAVLALQVYSLSRQGGLERQVAQVAAEASALEHRLRGEIGGVQGYLHELAKAERWLSRPTVAVNNTASCDAADVRISWELMNWGPDTRSRLLYRQGETGEWQEAAVQPLGGQGYAARFTATGAPVVQPNVSVSREDNRSSAAQMVETAGRPHGLLYQYQILAEGPGGSRSTGAEHLDLAKAFWAPAQVHATVLPDQRYQAQVLTKPEPDVCSRVDEAVVRAYAGGDQVGTYRLGARGVGQLHAEWQSDVPLTRLEFVLTVNGKTQVVPVHL